jgi:predicted transposase/invertase (TIGR01784 family)
MRYLDPKNDLPFWKVFGGHPRLLKSFLNAILPLSVTIKDLEYLPADMVPELPLLMYPIVNVRCFDEQERQFIVEMQMLWTNSFKTRVQFNANKAYVRHLDKGNEYKELQPVYALGLVNQVFEHDMEQFYHHYKIVHLANTNKVLKGLEFVFVEIPKFKAANYNEKRLQVLWLRYLSEIKNATETISPELFEVQEIREAIEMLEESAYTKSEMAAYDKYWDNISVERTLLSDSYVEGKMEGKIEGKIEGKMEIAKRALKKGLSINDIVELTELSEDEIKD